MIKTACRSAFTLIELLVTVVIVAILVGVSLSALLQAEQAARQGACLQNISSLTVATQTWVTDNGGAMPEGRVRTAFIQQNDDWYNSQLIPNYLPAELRCPVSPPTVGDGFRYAINDNLRYFFPQLKLPVPSSRVVLVSEMYYFGDGFWTSAQLTYTQNGVVTGGKIQAHAGGLNLGFLDGHVEHVTPPMGSDNKPNWSLPPVYAHDLNTGYYYDEVQFECMSLGDRQW